MIHPPSATTDTMLRTAFQAMQYGLTDPMDFFSVTTIMTLVLLQTQLQPRGGVATFNFLYIHCQWQSLYIPLKLYFKPIKYANNAKRWSGHVPLLIAKHTPMPVRIISKRFRNFYFLHNKLILQHERYKNYL